MDSAQTFWRQKIQNFDPRRLPPRTRETPCRRILMSRWCCSSGAMLHLWAHFEEFALTHSTLSRSHNPSSGAHSLVNSRIHDKSSCLKVLKSIWPSKRGYIVCFTTHSHDPEEASEGVWRPMPGQVIHFFSSPLHTYFFSKSPSLPRICINDSILISLLPYWGYEMRLVVYRRIKFWPLCAPPCQPWTPATRPNPSYSYESMCIICCHRPQKPTRYLHMAWRGKISSDRKIWPSTASLPHQRSISLLFAFKSPYEYRLRRYQLGWEPLSASRDHSFFEPFSHWVYFEYRQSPPLIAR